MYVFLLATMCLAADITGVMPATVALDPGEPNVEFSVEGGRARVSTDEKALDVRCTGGNRTKVSITGFEGAFAARVCEGGAAFTVRNTSNVSLRLHFTIEGINADGVDTRHRQRVELPAATEGAFPVYTYNHGTGPYWGMQGLPVYGPAFFDGQAAPVLEPPVSLRALLVEVSDPPRGATFQWVRVEAFAPGEPVEQLAPHPFIDEFGQFAGLDDAHKIHSVEELIARDAAEAAELAAAPRLPEFDAMGGWATGPQREATGRFRTEKVDGRWWFVTPEGRLFFSLGVNCLHRGDSTFVTGREGWFSWTPQPEGPFGAFVRQVSGVHSRAEAIGGQGMAVNFHGINLARKYGGDWEPKSRERALARLTAWGFNTVGNWSNTDMLTEGKLPFTVTGHSGAAMPVEASSGYWSPMKDVYDPQFVPNTRAAMEKLAQPWRDQARVIGYFVDNELSWAGVGGGVLASPPDQPARVVFTGELQEQYGSLAALNEAWGADAVSWDALRLPTRGSKAARADVEAFEYRFASHYFKTVRDALAEFAPGQLYLGCRFTIAYMPPPVVRACAEFCDVISMNAYLDEIRPGFLEEYDKPVIIGEFHFGARDRGMFHPGLVAAADQAERAAKYVRYVESVAKSPVFAGCHWFQYMDQPVTGRSLDGENFNIGLVNGVDLPYPELTAAARELHGHLYRARHEGAW
jgi:hypothetical protein